MNEAAVKIAALVEFRLAKCHSILPSNALGDEQWQALKDSIGVNIRSPRISQAVYEMLSAGLPPEKVVNLLRQPRCIWNHVLHQPEAIHAFTVWEHNTSIEGV